MRIFTDNRWSLSVHRRAYTQLQKTGRYIAVSVEGEFNKFVGQEVRGRESDELSYQVRLPGVYRSRSCQSDGKLTAAFDFDDAKACQRLDLHRYFTAVATTSTQLSVIAVAPTPHVVIVGDAESLRVAASTGYVDYLVILESLDQFRRQLILALPMAQPSVST